MKRALFWIVFLAIAGGAFAHLWKTKDPLNNHPLLVEHWATHNIRLLAHPHPRVANDAWLRLWNLFFTKWQVYNLFPAHVADDAPISFLIERKAFPAGGDQPAMDAYFAEGKPVFYRSDQVPCRTVGDALMAIMYREKKWKVDYQGDWKAWWEANKQYYVAF